MAEAELNLQGYLTRTELLATHTRPRAPRPPSDEEDLYLQGADFGYATALAWAEHMVRAICDLAILTGARDVAIFTDRISGAAIRLRRTPFEDLLSFEAGDEPGSN